ncbi:MAG: glycosyltransferase family 39 protein [Planctomycetota bacterium]
MSTPPGSQHPYACTASVTILLVVHSGLLAFSATQHSPTSLEPAFLASGLSHWRFGDFHAYNVNPPFPRMIAAIPSLLVGYEDDWSRYQIGPGIRSEFAIGQDFVNANGFDTIKLCTYARWACIPFSLTGAFFAYRWSKELYGPGGGLITLLLWAFEPNLLGHAALATPDCASWSFGILAGYTFWRWLEVPSWRRAMPCGLAMGLAESSKMTWLILYALWPILWILIQRPWAARSSGFVSTRPNDGTSAVECQFSAQNHPAHRRHSWSFYAHSGCQLGFILFISVYITNLGYAFDGTFTRLGDFEFVSGSLSGGDPSGKPGNVFEGTCFENVVIPFPKQYILGIDNQKRDFEDYIELSYLRGEWKRGGWWYYYLYGLLIKMPCGDWCLLLWLLAAHSRVATGGVWPNSETVIHATAISLAVLVSSQTAFNIHLRYAFPVLAYCLVFLGKAVRFLRGESIVAKAICLGMICYASISSLLAYPSHLSYFNEFVGGPSYGYKHLLGSSYDWGQDLLRLRQAGLGDGTGVFHVGFRPISARVIEAILPNCKSLSDSGTLGASALPRAYIIRLDWTCPPNSRVPGEKSYEMMKQDLATVDSFNLNRDFGVSCRVVYCFRNHRNTP